MRINCCSIVIFIILYWQSSAQFRLHSQSKRIRTKHQIQDTSTYGVDLPGFAIDFSEYFVNAAIIPANEKEFYLTMLLLGHQTIYEDHPFEAISTDEKTLSKWSQAIKIWKKEHDLHRSYKRRYFCVITSTTNTNSTHKSPVTWLEGSKRLDSSETNLNRNFELIRCRINPSLLLSSPPNTLWHVDIIEIGRRNRSAIIRGLNYHTVISYSLHSDSNNTQLRYSGYPLVSSNPNFHQEINPVLKSQSRICACIGSIRPYQSPRPIIGIPSLLEQIEHLLGLGVSHIYLGLMMTW